MAKFSNPPYQHAQELVCIGWLRHADEGSSEGFLRLQPQQLAVAGWLALVPVEIDIYFRRVKRVVTVDAYTKTATEASRIKSATLNFTDILKSTAVALDRLDSVSGDVRTKDPEYLGGEATDV